MSGAASSRILGKMNTVGDLQGGIEEAERLLGYKVAALMEPPQAT